MSFTEVDNLGVKSIRCLSAELPTVANSGHPGAPMGMATIAHVLWTRHMRFNPENPQWFNRDRFVLSNGHACALLYTMLHLTGYKQFPMEALKNFRQLDSITPGHPENHMDEFGDIGGVEVTTGPLGQGIANAVGLALAESHMAALFNTDDVQIVDSYTYVTVGDGCLQEGVSGEASSLAGHLGLGKLIVLYDDNSITIDGSTDVSFTEDVKMRYESYGWQVLEVFNGDDDLEAIDAAIRLAKADAERPTLIKVRTTIGVDSILQGTAKVHGSPLKIEEVMRIRKLYGLKEELHSAPENVLKMYTEAGQKAAKAESNWNDLMKTYASKYPEKAKQLTTRIAGKIPEDFAKNVPSFSVDDKANATRKLGNAVLSELVKTLPQLIGGSADLTGSNLTRCVDQDYQKDSRQGTYLRFGVREHGMAAICNGLAAYNPGTLIPHCATFLNFLQYLLPAFRLSALSHFGVIYVMTHDSIGLGQDGPTHQPINAAAIVRSTPNSLFIRPCDGNETAGAWTIAVENRNRPSVLALTRQGVPHIEGTSVDGVRKGAYVVGTKVDKPEVVLCGTGSEVQLCIEAAKQLKNAQVVSFPCWTLFEEQSQEYKDSVFPPGVTVVSCEALSTFGWAQYSDKQVGVRGWGSSAAADLVYKKKNVTVEAIVNAAQ